MSTPNGALRVDAVDCPAKLRAQLNDILARLQGQTGMVYNLEPTRKAYIVVTTTYTVAGTDYIIRADATGGAFTVTLPPVADVARRTYQIKKVDAGINAVTVDGNGAETIDGAATQALAVAYQSLTLYSNGASWDLL